MSKSYQIFADSAHSLEHDDLMKTDIEIIPLSFIVKGEEILPEKEKVIDFKPYYDLMRAGEKITTSAIPPEKFRQAFEKYLKQGIDIINFSFSGKLSVTFKNSVIVAEELKKEYPERKIYTIDSCAACTGYGVFLLSVDRRQKEGYSIDQLYDYALDLKDKIIHLVTVDDLKYLQRGGRLSAPAAFFGSLLGIKPLIHVRKDGTLEPFDKVRGRKIALLKLAQLTEESYDPNSDIEIYITHADSPTDAEELGKMIKTRLPNAKMKYSMLDMVIGAHVGPGTVTSFFIGKSKYK